jgi:hypothetical protein
MEKPVSTVEEQIDTGDEVLHGPTGEKWLVAYVRGDRLAWCGWPQGEAALADCTLLMKADPEARDKLLLEMAALGNDARATYARDRLAHDADARNEELAARTA